MKSKQTVIYTRFLSNVKKKDFQKLAGLCLVGEVVDHVGLYGSKVAEGCSAFKRRSCQQSPTELTEVDFLHVWTIFQYHTPLQYILE